MDNSVNIDDLKTAYHDGKLVKVLFTKANGDERVMKIQRSPVMESAVKNGKEKNPDVLRVVERTDDGIEQWRSVPLTRVKSFEVL